VIATPFLEFKISKVIEASKRFGRGCKPRPASSVWSKAALAVFTHR